MNKNIRPNFHIIFEKQNHLNSGRLIWNMIHNNIRFIFVWNVNSEKFDLIFAFATFLSPKWSPSLADNLAEVTETGIKRMVALFVFEY